MKNTDRRVDAYIAAAAPFAKPVLRYLRGIVHEGCPEVEETIKWGFPHFMYKGILCSMAAFNSHCAFLFWKGASVVDSADKSDEAMGQFGRITKIEDLPSRTVLQKYVKKACLLKDSGLAKTSNPRPKVKKELVVPTYFFKAVKGSKKALATFEAFPYSKKKDYVEWVEEAKTEETRAKRLKTTVEWLAEGKSRNWKYEKC